ncbi:MAG: hypothetical protein J7L88_04200, partial [Thermoplasmata archaeon]|nr:hypothetical protein [Thermoplasmata archaeon]
QELLKEIDKKTKFREVKEEVRRPPRKKPKVKRARRARRKKEKTPDVVTIVEQGVYEIDVKKLLEKSPIIVQKDGSYLIHLPSLFEMEEKEEE